MIYRCGGGDSFLNNGGNYRLEKVFYIIISKEARPGLWVDGVDRCRVIELDACTAHAVSVRKR